MVDMTVPEGQPVVTAQRDDAEAAHQRGDTGPAALVLQRQAGGPEDTRGATSAAIALSARGPATAYQSRRRLRPGRRKAVVWASRSRADGALLTERT